MPPPSDARDVVLDVVAIVGAAAERGGSAESTLETVLDRVAEGFGARLAAIYVAGADGALALRAVRPATAPPAEALSPDRQPALVAALEAGRDAVGGGVPGAPRELAISGLDGGVVVPARAGSVTVGALALVLPDGRAMSDEERVSARAIAQILAMELRNTQLFAGMRDRARELDRQVRQLAALTEVARGVARVAGRGATPTAPSCPRPAGWSGPMRPCSSCATRRTTWRWRRMTARAARCSRRRSGWPSRRPRAARCGGCARWRSPCRRPTGATRPSAPSRSPALSGDPFDGDDARASRRAGRPGRRRARQLPPAGRPAARAGRAAGPGRGPRARAGGGAAEGGRGPARRAGPGADRARPDARRARAGAGRRHARGGGRREPSGRVGARVGEGAAARHLRPAPDGAGGAGLLGGHARAGPAPRVARGRGRPWTWPPRTSSPRRSARSRSASSRRPWPTSSVTRTPPP